MYSTQAYIYQQRTQVLMLDSSGQYFTMRYNNVYAKKLTLNLGVDNVLLFSFVNQDEKPVNVTGGTFTFRVTNTAGTEILLQEPMTILNACSGQVKVYVPAADTLELIAQPASYSITMQRGNLTQAVFTNAQSGARGDIDLVNSVLPQFVPSYPLTIPTTKLSAQATTDGTGYENYPNWAGGGAYWNGNGDGTFYNSYLNTEYYSSFIEPQNYVTTIQMNLVGFTGTIKAQWAQNYQSVWANCTETQTYYNETRTVYLNVIGWYPLLRVCFNNSVFASPNPPAYPALAYAFCDAGSVTSITVQNPGAGYLAPPKISILGDGSGAVAEAVLAPNVDSITLTNPGLGYTAPPTITLVPSIPGSTGAGATASCTIDGTGAINSISIADSGNGYLYPPTVIITPSDGNLPTTPASAVTTVNTDGSILAINVINGGSGYWPIPSGGVNPNAYPVPPQNQGAYIAISTGYITDLFYR